MSENYNANSIQTLSFLEAVRTRIAMYMGSADNQGVLQCVREIITNSIDEATMGFGNKITIDLYEGNRIKISDEGRGCPFGKREDGTEALEAIYTMAHSGAKFNDKVFQNVAGQNGIGGKGVALSSDYFQVWSYRDGKCATMWLEKGIKKGYEEKTLSKNDPSTGTIVEFIPSQEVYNLETIKFDFDEIKKMCQDWSYLSKGVSFILHNHITNEKVTYLSKKGLLDLMTEKGGKIIHKTPLSIVVEENGIEAEIVMGWTNNRNETWHVFTNGLENVEGGTSLTGIKTALTNYFKKKLKGEAHPDVLRKGLFYAVSCKVPNPSFANQTKTKVNNPELRGLCQRATTQMLETFELRHNDEFKKVLELLTRELKAEVAAENARKKVLESEKEVINASKKGNFDVDKLADAENLGNDAILLLVEGKSAGGAMQRVRDPKKYGILKLRGKIINALSNNFEDVMKNEEVRLFLKATGININRYHDSKLRYGKVAICVDADDDGMHIACLIICLLYKLAPDFLKEGRLCWLHAPLFKVKKGKETKFYYTEEQMRVGIKGEQTRFKGLGEMKDEDARSMFDNNQWLEILEWDDEVSARVEALMGKDSAPKKDFVFSRIDFEKLE